MVLIQKWVQGTGPQVCVRRELEETPGLKFRAAESRLVREAKKKEKYAHCPRKKKEDCRRMGTTARQRVGGEK